MARRAKSERDFEIRSLIVCDDLREEKSGKDILIGVYSDTLLFASFPAALPKLVFRVVVLPKHEGLKKFKFIVKNDGGDVKIEFNSDLPPYRMGSSTTLAFVIVNLHFDKPDAFNLFFGISQEPVPIARIELRLPENEEERRRISV